MIAQDKQAQLDISPFSKPHGRSGDFFVDNYFKVLGGIFLTFILIALSMPFLKYIGIPVIILWSVSVNLFFRHTGKLAKARQLEVLQEFAKHNNFTLQEDAKYSSSGVIFVAGNNDHSTGEILEGSLYGHKISAYLHKFSTSSGKSRMTHYYGVIEIELPKTVPHIFIDSTKNNWIFGETLDVFKRADMVQLEGDFNDYFRIFAAKDYGIEVFTLLNPAFMQQLIQRATGFECELIDNKAFVYVNNVIIFNQDSITKMFEAAEFLILNLDKQLDTFKFHPYEKTTNQIEQSRLKKIISKI